MIRQSLTFLVRFPSIRNRDLFFLENPYALVAGLVVLTTFVTAMIAILFQGVFRALFESVVAVGVAWIGMGGALMISWKIQNGVRSLHQMNHRDAFLIGLAQGFAIIPGISRAGMTIMIGMACGLEKREAARFSFFAAMAVIAGAGLMEAREGLHFFSEQPLALVVGFVTSALVDPFLKELLENQVFV